MMQSQKTVEFLEMLAEKAGAAAMPYFRTPMSVTDKADQGAFDPVTLGDQAAEKAIRHEIGARFPDHGILGEEFGTTGADAEYVWVIDPIDGTRSFISGIPLWGTLIGLMRHGVPVMGLMHQPYIGESFISDGTNSWMKGPHGERPLKTRACSDLSQAFMMTTSPGLFVGTEADSYRSVETQVRLARYGADCYAYAMLAAGHIDLVIESGLKPYDIVALIPIIEAAGGIVTNWRGDSAAAGGQIIASGDMRLHEKALRLLQQR